jgi:tripartite-type tricarboxylate transporter receptor subunit TctC
MENVMKSVQRWLLVAALLAAARIAAAAYPEQPIKVLMPFPPGSSVDVVTRLVASEASVLLGKPLVLDYRPGAAGVIATQAAARSPADGYTILITTPSHTINPALKKDLPFNTEADFAPVSLIATIPELLVVHPSMPFNTVGEFIRHAKANPGKLNYSSAGTGTHPHMAMEVLLRRADIKVTHVPYKGGAPALTDLIAGVVQLKLDTYATAQQHLTAGKLKVLATAGRTRLPQLPNVPTIAEAGFPGYEGYLWIGALAPHGVPPDALGTLSGALAKAVRMPKVAERLRADGVEVVASTPEEFGRVIAQELPLWAKLASEANIKASD